MLSNKTPDSKTVSNVENQKSKSELPTEEPISDPNNKTSFPPKTEEKSSSAALKTLLQANYEKRAEIHSAAFPKHILPIHDVHFTIDLNKSKEDAQQYSEEKNVTEQENKSDAHPARTHNWSTVLRDQSGGEGAHRPIVVSQLFDPLKREEKPRDKQKEQTSEDAPEVSQSDVHRVLIIGKAGSGKTTLSKYIAHNWAQPEEGLWSNRYNQVFWIILQDLHSMDKAELELCLRSPFPLAAFIHRTCLNKEDRQKIGIKAIHHLLRDQPQKTLLIGDGFDPVARLLSTPETDQAKMLKILLDTSCDLLVTSREYSLPPSNVPFDRRLVNRGFTDEQVNSYVHSYFDSLAPPDPALEKEVLRLIKKNSHLWSHVHNPLILMLTCDFYCNAKLSGKQVLDDLNLLDLYEDVLCFFIRRYLDWQSQFFHKPELALERTKAKTLEELIEYCPVEIDFLQELSYLGVKQGVPQLDGAMNKTALAKTLTKFPHHPRTSDGRFIEALNLGFLHEHSEQQQDSALDKTHEFIHLTFQEFLAARQIAERLKRNDREAYQWLRKNKYHPSYREVLNFICTMMTREEYPIFWQVLLDEHADITGYAHLQLIMYSLEAVRCNQYVSNRDTHLAAVRQAIIASITYSQLNNSWLRTAMRYCPNVVGELSAEIFNKIIQALEKPFYEIYDFDFSFNNINYLLDILKSQFKQLSLTLRRQLLNALINSNNLKMASAFYEEVAFFPHAERSDLLADLLRKIHVYYEKTHYGDRYQDEKEGALRALSLYALHVGQITSDERNELLEILLREIEGHSTYRAAFINYVSQAWQFSETERSDLLARLMANHKNSSIFLATKSYVANAEQLPKTERSQLLTIVLTKIRNGTYTHFLEGVIEKLLPQFSKEEYSQLFIELLTRVKYETPSARRNDWKILEFYASHVERLSPDSHHQLLTKLCAATKDENFSIRICAWQGLAKYASHLKQFHRTLFTTLLTAVEEEDYHVRGKALNALISYIDQAKHFSSNERDLLLTTLLILLKNEHENVRADTWDVLERYATEVGSFPEKERDELCNKLCSIERQDRSGQFGILRSFIGQAKHLSVTQRTHLLNAALLSSDLLSSYVKQVGHFLPEERSRLLAILLSSFKTANSNSRQAVLLALEYYIDEAAQFPIKEQLQLFKTLFESNVPKISDLAVHLLDMISWPSHELLQLPYERIYPVLDKKFQRGEFLKATPLDQLLAAYLTDTAAGLLNFYPRRNLWLQFIVARTLHEGNAIRIVSNRLELYGPSYRDPLPFSILTSQNELVSDLRNAFYLQAKKFNLATYEDKAEIKLDSESKSTIVWNASVTDALEARVNKLEEKTDKIETHLDKHDQQFDAVASSLKNLQEQIAQQDAELKKQDTIISQLQKNTKETINTMHAFQNTVKDSIVQGMEELTRLQSQMDEIQSETKKTDRRVGGLEEKTAALEVQQTALQDAYHKNEQKLLEHYEKLAAELKDCVSKMGEQQTKEEAVRDEQRKVLENSQTELNNQLKAIHEQLTNLDKIEAHSAEELIKLQQSQEKLLQLYQSTETRLAERQNLLKDPKLAKFYREMHTKLSGFFLVCTMVSTGLVKAELTSSLSQQIAKKFLGVLGDNIPVPGVSAATSFISAMIDWRREKQHDTHIEQTLLASPISFADKEIAVEEAVQETVRRYKQISSLTEKGIKDAAACAVNRIAHGVQEEESLSEDDKIKESFPMRMVNYLHRVKLKQGSAGLAHKVLETEKGVLLKHKPWTEDGFFRRLGIHSKNMYFYTDKREDSLFDNRFACHYQKYGFRDIDDDLIAEREAKQQGFELKSITNPSDSYQLTLQPSTEKAPRYASMFHKAAEAITEVAVDKAQEELTKALLDNNSKITVETVTSISNAVINTVKQAF